MTKNTLHILQDHELLALEKPAQYIGGEIGSITKNDTDIAVNICLAFPDTYEVGMSHTGYQILYDLINQDPRFWAERAYTPLPDMEELLRRRNLPLTSLESKRPLSQFDIVGFSLQYELCMSGILLMLDLGGIPLLQTERNDTDPLIIGGGPVAYHPEPFADFFDCFLVGDGEELVPEFLAKCSTLNGLSRTEKLRELSKIQGVYVPSFFTPKYSITGAFQGMLPTFEDYTSIKRRVIASLENAPFPKTPIVPNIKSVHDRLAVEVMRGCVRGCRFCQAGYLYRPQRERPPEEIRNIAQQALEQTGFEELSLLSLSTADYCSILPLLKVLKDEFADENRLAISFPSTRVDALTPELLQEVQPVRRTGFTMAPEAGTQRLRDVINKGVTDEQIITTCQNVLRLGWSSIKLYFMIGLPTETDEDLLGIVDIARRVNANAGRGKKITISISTHIPKPHTPFQWAEQISEGETLRRQQLLFQELRKLKIFYRYHDAKSSFLEGVFARGDRRLGAVILKAYELGTRQDGWMEALQFDRWMEALETLQINPDHYLKEKPTEAPLPWDHISCDIPTRWFQKEWDRATASRTTPDCLTKTCSTCGACDYDGVRNVLFDRSRSETRLNIISPPWTPIIEAREAGGSNEEIVRLLNYPDLSSQKALRKRQNTTYQLKEYLQTEGNDSTSTSIPSSKKAFRYRATYTKLGQMRFHGHLELTSIFFRAARRAELPIAFSQGFTPRPRFAFGQPLQLGVESLGECMDMYLFAMLTREEIMLRFNEKLPEGLQITQIENIPANSPPIQAASLSSGYIAQWLNDSEFKEDIESTWQQKTIERTRKKKTKSFLLNEFVTTVKRQDNELFYEITAHSNGTTLKPLEVIACLTESDSMNFIVRKVIPSSSVHEKTLSYTQAHSNTLIVSQ